MLRLQQTHSETREISPRPEWTRSNCKCWYFCQFDTVLLLAILLLPLHNFINRNQAVQVNIWLSSLNQ
jgi:hypothetical protein